jgi:hypothetical protein
MRNLVMQNKQDITVLMPQDCRDGACPIAVRLRAESPVINSTGQRPVEDECISTTSPERAKSGYWT